MNLAKYKPLIAKSVLVVSSFCIGTHYGPELKEIYTGVKQSAFGTNISDPSYENAQLLVGYVYEAKK